MSVTKRGAVYYADLRDLCAGRHSLFTRDKTLAHELYRRVKRLALDGKKIDPSMVKRMAQFLHNMHETARVQKQATDAAFQPDGEYWSVVFLSATGTKVTRLMCSRNLAELAHTVEGQAKRHGWTVVAVARGALHRR